MPNDEDKAAQTSRKLLVISHWGFIRHYSLLISHFPFDTTTVAGRSSRSRSL